MIAPVPGHCLLNTLSGLITSVGERELMFLPSFSSNYVVSVRRGFLLLPVLGIGCVTSSPEP